MKEILILFTALFGLHAIMFYVSACIGMGEKVAEAYGILYSSHLMRSLGLLFGILSALNAIVAFELSTLLFVFNNLGGNAPSQRIVLSLDAIVVLHYLVESFVFQALRFTIVLPLLLILGFSMYNIWFFKAKEEELKKKM